MIAACWITITAAYTAYGLVASVSTGTARDFAVPFALLAVAAWAVLTSHHDRGHR